MTRNLSLALQLLSVLAFTGAGIYLRNILLFFYPETRKVTDIFLLLFFILSPFLLKAALLCMSDMLSMFFISGGIYHLLLYLRRANDKDLWWTVFFMGNAFLARLPAAVILIIPALITLYTCLIRGKKVRNLFIILSLAGLALLPFAWVLKDYSPSTHAIPVFAQWDPLNYFRSAFQHPDGYFAYRLPNLLYAGYNIIHPGYFFAGFILLFAGGIRHYYKRYMGLIWIPAIIYAFFIAGFPYQNSRFMILSAPFWAVLVFPGFHRIYLSVQKKKGLSTIMLIAIFLIQGLLFTYAFRPIWKRNQLEKDISESLRQFPPGELYTFDMDVALRSYGIPQETLSMWENEITAFSAGSLVLFNPDKFERQWEGKNPMINWKRLESGYQLEMIEEFSDGWGLYRIKIYSPHSTQNNFVY